MDFVSNALSFAHRDVFSQDMNFIALPARLGWKTISDTFVHDLRAFAKLCMCSFYFLMMLKIRSRNFNYDAAYSTCDESS